MDSFAGFIGRGVAVSLPLESSHTSTGHLLTQLILAKRLGHVGFDLGVGGVGVVVLLGVGG